MNHVVVSREAEADLESGAAFYERSAPGVGKATDVAMVEVIWTEPVLAGLDEIADYIAVDNPTAARALVARVFERVEKLATHLEIGPQIPELKRSRYRQLSEPPCRIFYRLEGGRAFIMRGERLFRPTVLRRRR